MTPAQAVRRLVDHGVIEASWVVDGDVVLRDVSRSNAVFLVDAGGTRLVVKAGLDGPAGDHGSARAERMIYAAASAAGAPLPLPRQVTDADDLLVLEHVEPTSAVQRFEPGPGLPRVADALLGAALGRWHAATDLQRSPDDWSRALAATLPRRIPWVLTSLSAQPPAFLRADVRLAGLLEPLTGGHPLGTALAAALTAWQVETVVHGDVRWDNALLADGPDGPEVLLVDWEFAAVGDPAWDVACARADALAQQIVAGGPRAVVPVTDASADGIAAGYLRARPDGGGALERSPAYLPARLLQIAAQHVVWDPVGGVRAAQALLEAATSLAEHTAR